MKRRLFSVFLLSLLACTLTASRPQLRNPSDHPIGIEEFGHLMASLSEPEGYFDSDNFVSNEAAYLRIIPALMHQGVKGGVYVGVGPDQNYSYIAAICPKLAIIIDIRRQNALQHLYYKSLFQLSKNRVEYLERLFGRPIQQNVSHPEPARIAEILKEIDRAGPNKVFVAHKLPEATRLIRSWGLGLRDEDIKAVDYIANAFIEGGPDLKFTSYNRAPRPHHPTYRTLLEETDGSGAQLSYLASEDLFRTVKSLHQENRILPIVGDFGGAHAFRGIAEELRRRGLEVTCLYASNVEFYLFRGEQWAGYVRNLKSLPLARTACVIRAYANYWRPHPAEIPGYYMTTVLQSLHNFLANEAAGNNESYWDIVTRARIFP